MKLRLGLVTRVESAFSGQVGSRPPFVPRTRGSSFCERMQLMAPTNTMIRENRDTAPPGSRSALGDLHMDAVRYHRAMFYFAHCTFSTPSGLIATTTAEAALASFANVMATCALSAARRLAIAAPMPCEP
jgi:hypothetical protein